MKSVLIVMAIALVAIGASIALKESKDLTPRPADREQARRDGMEQELAVKTPKPTATETFSPPKEGMLTATLSIAGRGDIDMELYPKAAPKTVGQFTTLIKSGFYNGLRVHRVDPGFVIQAGDPQSKTEDIESKLLGTQGSGKEIPFEPNALQHVEGTVSMALSAPQSNTGDSQFFINLKSNHSLDADYCVFGRVTKGMDVVKQVAKGDTITKMVVH